MFFFLIYLPHFNVFIFQPILLPPLSKLWCTSIPEMAQKEYINPPLSGFLYCLVSIYFWFHFFCLQGLLFFHSILNTFCINKKNKLSSSCKFNIFHDFVNFVLYTFTFTFTFTIILYMKKRKTCRDALKECSTKWLLKIRCFCIYLLFNTYKEKKNQKIKYQSVIVTTAITIIFQFFYHVIILTLEPFSSE